MPTLEENINKVIEDLDNIQTAIEESGVEVPYGTNTSEYGALIKQVYASAADITNITIINGGNASGNT